MRTRQNDWINIRTDKIHRSFQVFVGGKWCFLSRGKRPLFFKTEEERDRIQAVARKAKTTRQLDEMLEKATRKRAKPGGDR